MSDLANQYWKLQAVDAKKELATLNKWYDGHALDAFHGKVNDGRAQAAKQTPHGDMALIYGEIKPSSILNMYSQLGAHKGTKFFDLGSGTGKPVVMAALLGLDATGIELVQGRFDTACNYLDTAKKMIWGRDGPEYGNA